MGGLRFDWSWWYKYGAIGVSNFCFENKNAAVCGSWDRTQSTSINSVLQVGGALVALQSHKAWRIRRSTTAVQGRSDNGPKSAVDPVSQREGYQSPVCWE